MPLALTRKSMPCSTFGVVHAAISEYWGLLVLTSRNEVQRYRLRNLVTRAHDDGVSQLELGSQKSGSLSGYCAEIPKVI